MPQDNNATPLSDSEKKKEDWMNSKWRPLMGYVYMGICTCDFIIFPVMWSIMHTILHTQGGGSQWQPLTLQGAGLLHLSFGAILGVAAFGRTQEKLAGKAGDNGAGFSTPAPSFTSSPTPSFATAPAFTPAPAPAFGSAKPAGPAFVAQLEL
jgi:hypothetical protein